MMLRLASLLAAAVIIPGLGISGLAFGDEIVGGGAKIDETSRDSPYINDATKASDPSAVAAQRAKDSSDHTSAAPRARPIHRALLRKSHGVITTTDIYVLPNTDARDRAPLY